MPRKLLLLFIYALVSVLAYLLSVWSPQTLTENIFHSALVLTALYGVIAVGLEELLVRRVSDNKTRYNIRKVIWLLLLVAVLVWWLRIWVPNPQALLVAYGVIAAGLAVALQDVVKNIAGGIAIFATGMYQVGNRIEINHTCGDVIDIGLFNTTLLEVREWIDADQATGRITTVPNGVVLSKPVQNFTKLHEFLWDELSAVVTPESNWSEAMQILLEIGQEHTEKFVAEAEQSLTNLERYYYLEGHVLRPNVYISPVADGYKLTLRYVVNAWKRRSTNSEIWGHVIRVFGERDDVVMAPTTIARVSYPVAEE